MASTDRATSLNVFEASLDGLVESLTLLVVKVVATRGQNIIEGDEFNDFTFGQVGGLVEYETAVVDVSFERLHRSEVYSPASLVPRSNRRRPGR